MPPETFRLSPYPLRGAPHWGSACRDPFMHCGKSGEGVEVLGGKGRLRRPLPPKGTSPPPANLHHFVDRATAGGPSAHLHCTCGRVQAVSPRRAASSRCPSGGLRGPNGVGAIPDAPTAEKSLTRGSEVNSQALRPFSARPPHRIASEADTCTERTPSRCPCGMYGENLTTIK